MERNFQDELNSQSSLLTVWYAGTGFAILLSLVVGANDHPFVMFFMWGIIAVLNAVNLPPMLELFEKRKKLVAFKQQVENLYVFSDDPDEHVDNGGIDDTVWARFTETLEILRESGNQHGVKVYMCIFRDVAVFCGWIDANDKIQQSKEWRSPGSASEKWGDYVMFCETLKREKDETRLRDLRANPLGFDWVNARILGQQIPVR